jgi:hypothetical protein
MVIDRHRCCAGCSNSVRTEFIARRARKNFGAIRAIGEIALDKFFGGYPVESRFACEMP